MTAREYISTLAPKWYVALFRVFVGYYYLHVGVNLMLGVRSDGDFLKNKLVALESVPQLSWFQPYLQTVVDPVRDAGFLTVLLVAAPALLGVSLVIGLFTRVSSLLGALLVANIYLVQFNSAAVTHRMSLELQFAALLTLCFAGAGRTYGIDGVFWKNRLIAKRIATADDPRRSEPRVPIIKDLPSIPLSDNKPSLRPPEGSGPKAS
jgi:uncharacterized membrane protein YphA (DoxX/SURF4 family)